MQNQEAERREAERREAVRLLFHRRHLKGEIGLGTSSSKKKIDVSVLKRISRHLKGEIGLGTSSSKKKIAVSVLERISVEATKYHPIARQKFMSRLEFLPDDQNPINSAFHNILSATFAKYGLTDELNRSDLKQYRLIFKENIERVKDEIFSQFITSDVYNQMQEESEELNKKDRVQKYLIWAGGAFVGVAGLVYLLRKK